jgi:hypothetical protein
LALNPGLATGKQSEFQKQLYDYLQGRGVKEALWPSPSQMALAVGQILKQYRASDASSPVLPEFPRPSARSERTKTRPRKT